MGEKANTNVEDVKPNEIDILGRDEFVDNCRLLINTIFDTTKSAFIMIDGEWGVGKTFVMNVLDKKLRDDYNIIKYNCWENSYYADPLEAILSVMLDYIDKSSLWSNADKEKFKALGMIALNLLSLGSINILNKAVEKATEYVGEDKNSIYTIIQEVKDFINSNKEKIIILVDEIDRCLPEYGVKTLERLYLLFKDVPNFVIVIANDKSKMEMSIQNAFGYKSIDNYLEKFIDYVLKLNICNIFNKKEIVEKKYKYYFEKFKLCGEYWEFFICLFSNKNARYIERTINTAYKLHNLYFESWNSTDYILMTELAILEYCHSINFFSLKKIMSYYTNSIDVDNISSKDKMPTKYKIYMYFKEISDNIEVKEFIINKNFPKPLEMREYDLSKIDKENHKELFYFISCLYYISNDEYKKLFDYKNYFIPDTKDKLYEFNQLKAFYNIAKLIN